MANNYTDYSKNLMLGQIPTQLYVSLHSADPTDVGSNQVAGTTRPVINLNAATAGERQAQEAFVDITVPAGSDVAFIGLFDAASAGNFVAYAPILDESGQPTVISFSQELPFRVTDPSIDLNNE